MTEPTEWTWEGGPTEPGIYAVARCYDPEDGVFPDHDEWRGPFQPSRKWSGKGVVGFAGPFQTVKAARDWAYAHDPEGV